MTVISILIPSREPNNQLYKLLNLIQTQINSANNDSIEVLVSFDCKYSVSELENFKSIKFLKGPNKGPAANRNFLASHANGRWYVFIDDDCLPEPTWLNTWLEEIKAPSDRVIYDGITLPIGERDGMDSYFPTNADGTNLWSCNFLIKKEDFELLNGFDERFRYPAMEDVDFRLRAKKMGFIIRPSLGAKILHPWKKVTIQKLLEQEQSMLLYISLHPSEGKILTPYFFIKSVVREFIKETIPELFLYRGVGLHVRLYKHIQYLQLAFKLLFKNLQ